MSTDTQDMDFATKPLPEHEWLNNLVGEWRVESEMTMGEDSMKGTLVAIGSIIGISKF